MRSLFDQDENDKEVNKLPAGWVMCPLCQERSFQRTSQNAGQKYCRECSADRDTTRKKLWAREHPQKYNPAERKVQNEARRDRLVEAGAATSTSKGIAWGADDDLELEWNVRVAVPFDYAMSKNAIWRSVGAGHVILREESNTIRANLTTILRDALLSESLFGHSVVTNRLWLDIFVEKPDHRGDAINVLDLVADAVKDACDLDDRWYSIRRLDWSIVKTDPRLFVGVSQQIGAVESQVCSYCGQILPLESFSKNRSAKNGRSRTCSPCWSAAQQLKKRRGKAPSATPERA